MSAASAPPLIERVRRAFAMPPVEPRDRPEEPDGARLASPGGAPLVAAAVLVPIVLRPEPTVLFTCRAESLRRHPGQIAFPGGRIDAADAGPVAAALREAEEEVGIPAGAVEVVGLTEPYVTGTGYSVTPVVGIIPPDLPLVLAPEEVAAVFEAPLDHIIAPANQELLPPAETGYARSIYRIRWGEHLIWGATAAMVVNVARRLARAAA